MGVPAWRPILMGAQAAIQAASLVFDASEENKEKAWKQSKALLETRYNLTPGGNIRHNVGKALWTKKHPGFVPTGTEMAGGIKAVFGIKGY